MSSEEPASVGDKPVENEHVSGCAKRPSLVDLISRIRVNENGWGPVDIPANFRSLPYQPFDKSERIFKIADWSGRDDRRYGGRAAQTNVFGAGSQYAYYHDDEDSMFQMVDTQKVPRAAPLRGHRLRQIQIARRMNQRERERRNQAQAAGRFGNRGRDAWFALPALSACCCSIAFLTFRKSAQWRQYPKYAHMRQRFENRSFPQIKPRAPSVQIKSTWEVLEEFELSSLQKLNLPSVNDGIDVPNEQYGSLEYYERSYDRITTRNQVPLMRINRGFYTVSTTDDPVIERLAIGKDYNVFGTDVIIATLMCCTRSVYSWDVVIHRVGNKLFFDKRTASRIDYPTVSETAIEPPQDEGSSINSPENLAVEAMYINRNFSQQVLKMDEEKYKFKNPDVPFTEDGGSSSTRVASVGYRYRHWNLGNNIELVVRCEHDGAMLGPDGQTQFLTIKAFNEWDSRFSGGIQWRSKIDTQRGAILATELKNNSCKLAKWTVQALLAGSDYLKFGYVSRIHSRDSSKHLILSTQQFKPTEFASQINLNMDNAWGILRCIIDKCFELAQGKYVLMKDPNKPMLLLYKVPADAFNEEEDEEEGASDGFEDGTRTSAA
ncbi:eukaryotic translation initiation factor 3 subunit 7 [Trichuris suis]|nr:eukaryotic translation initiation factor 3 subunit 7 [Trichuris suis]